MKITEKVTRECCDPPRDFKPYLGEMKETTRALKPQFCIHCGQVWVHGKEMGPAGSYDATLEKVTL